METLGWLLYFTNIMLDAVSLWQLRILVYSFLLSKRNIKGARKIHMAHGKMDRFTLSYIKKYTIYPKQYAFYHKMMIVYYASIIPQYVMLTVVGIFLTDCVFVSTSMSMLVIKAILAIIVRSQFTYSQSVSIYDKRHDSKHKK